MGTSATKNDPKIIKHAICRPEMMIFSRQSPNQIYISTCLGVEFWHMRMTPNFLQTWYDIFIKMVVKLLHIMPWSLYAKFVWDITSFVASNLHFWKQPPPPQTFDSLSHSPIDLPSSAPIRWSNPLPTFNQLAIHWACPIFWTPHVLWIPLWDFSVTHDKSDKTI